MTRGKRVAANLSVTCSKARQVLNMVGVLYITYTARGLSLVKRSIKAITDNKTSRQAEEVSNQCQLLSQKLTAGVERKRAECEGDSKRKRKVTGTVSRAVPQRKRLVAK